MPDRLPETSLDEHAAQAFLVLARSGNDPDLAPWTGGAHLGSAFLIAPRNSAPRLGFLSPMEREEAARSGLSLLTPEDLDVVRWIRTASSEAELLADVVSRGLHLCEVAAGPVAVAGALSAGDVLVVADRLAEDGWELVPGERISQRVRKTKDAAQIDEIRDVSAAVCDAFRRVAEVLAASTQRDGELHYGGEPLRVGALRGEIAVVLARAGLEQSEGNLIGAGEEGAVPHNTGDDARVLRPNESIIVDIYPKKRLFSDCTRTFCVGEPSIELRNGHAAVLETLQEAHAAAVPGVRGWALQETACERLRKAGFPTPISDPGTTRGYVHGLGHGVGFEVHEAPSFREGMNDFDGVLEVGDVVTLEPGLYEPEAGWAVRLEDLVVIGIDGNEILTPLPYDLDPRAWRDASESSLR